MSRQRSRSAAVFATLVAALLLVSPAVAGADTTAPGSYHAKADATALELKVFGQGITLGVTHAENASDPVAAASGLGALVPGIGNEVAQTASVSQDGTTDDHPEACGPITLPPDFPVVDLATACSAATAVIVGGLPSSLGDAQVASIDVNANEVLGDNLSEVNQAITEDLLPALQQVFDAVGQTGIQAGDLLSELIAAITEGGDLVRISLGDSTSSSSAGALTETAAASAKATTIELLPRDLLELAPVLTIEVGAASNTINVDRNTGTATVDYLAPLVRLTIAPDIATALGLAEGANVIDVPVSLVPTCFLPAPLESCITVASGTTSTDDQGVTHGNAAGVSLHLLTGVEDGIRLNLAATSVEGVGALEVSRDAPPPDLARTGGTVNTLLGGALLAVAIAGMTVARRSRRRLDLV